MKSKALKRTLRSISIVVAVVVVVYGIIASVLYSGVGAFPTSQARYPKRNIEELIWPTVGYPALVEPGGTVEMELDLPSLEGGKNPESPPTLRFIANPSRPEISSLSLELQEVGLQKGKSARWPYESKNVQTADVWKVAVELPKTAPSELYDISVDGIYEGKRFHDSEPHALFVTEEEGEDFDFITLADIHVHGRNISAFMEKQTDKGIAKDGRPVFFERAIDEVNLIRPDFVVLLGDFIRAQKAPGDYQKEFDWFYQTLTRFEVPVFALPGNHDLYVNEVDGIRVWEENLGPLYYSFDFRDCHFTAANTFEWPLEKRVVMEKFGSIIYPEKWQGQILGATREDDPETFDGQLGWLRDDLARAQAQKLRFLMLHHDPYHIEGRGDAYNSETFAGIFKLGGGGKGRNALLTLAEKYKVDMVMSGHLHKDILASLPWSNGEGKTTFAGQTCVYFDEGGKEEKYPGYRLVKVRGGSIESFSYLDDLHSFPFYDGSAIGGKTDLDSLSKPAISARKLEEGKHGWEISSYLAVPMEIEGLAVEIPNWSPDFYCSGGEISKVVPVAGKADSALVYVKTLMSAGKPKEGIRKEVLLLQEEASASPSTLERLRESSYVVGGNNTL